MTDKTESVVDVMARAKEMLAEFGEFNPSGTALRRAEDWLKQEQRLTRAALKNAGFAAVPVETITNLCDELEAEVQERYGHDARLKQKLDRDMITVREARAMIQAATGGE